jgi:hypothetical protein
LEKRRQNHLVIEVRKEEIFEKVSHIHPKI